MRKEKIWWQKMKIVETTDKEQLNRMIKRLEERAIYKFIDQYPWSAVISCLHEDDIKRYYQMMEMLEE